MVDAQMIVFKDSLPPIPPLMTTLIPPDTTHRGKAEEFIIPAERTVIMVYHYDL